MIQSLKSILLNNRKGIFITATGTEVGKTYVSSLLINTLKKENINVGYYKPALSGVDIVKEKAIAGDANYICKTCNIDTDPNSLVSYIYKTEVSPHLASVIENNPISLSKILSDYEKHKKEHEFLVVEGCGGIICPLNLNSENLMLTDVIKALNLDIIIVVNASLGTINSTILTIEYAKALNINIVGIILNRYDESNFLHIDNKISLEKLTDIPILTYILENSKTL